MQTRSSNRTAAEQSVTKHLRWQRRSVEAAQLAASARAVHTCRWKLSRECGTTLNLTCCPASIRSLLELSSCADRNAITHPMWCTRNCEIRFSCICSWYASTERCSVTSAGSFVLFHCSTRSENRSPCITRLCFLHLRRPRSALMRQRHHGTQQSVGGARRIDSTRAMHNRDISAASRQATRASPLCWARMCTDTRQSAYTEPQARTGVSIHFHLTALPW